MYAQQPFDLQGKVRPPSDADVAFITFMENLVEFHAEPRPENEERHLNPSQYPSSRAVYQAFLENYFKKHRENGDHSDEPPMTENTFVRKMQRDYPKLKIPKTNRFAQCDVCFCLRGKIEVASGPKKQYYREALKKHYQDILRDKAAYYRNR